MTILSRKKETFTEEELDMTLTRLLMDLSIPTRIQGFHFAKECAKTIYFNPQSKWKMNECVFRVVAEKFDSSNTKVERAIRHALTISCGKNRMAYLASIFKAGCDFDFLHPSVSEFISLLAEALFFLAAEKSLN